MLNENGSRSPNANRMRQTARLVKRAERVSRDGVKMSKEAQRAEVERIARIINGALKSLARLKEAIVEGS
jgi:hypothetical protein